MLHNPPVISRLLIGLLLIAIGGYCYLRLMLSEDNEAVSKILLIITIVLWTIAMALQFLNFFSWSWSWWI